MKKVLKKAISAIAALTVCCASTFSMATAYADSEPETGDEFTIGSLTYCVMTYDEVQVSRCDTSAVEISIPASVPYSGRDFMVTNIKAEAFNSCYDLESVTIADGMQNISDSAFTSCIGLKSIEIPESVVSLGWYTFSGCKNLEEINLPSGVSVLGDWLFRSCESLTDIVLEDNISIISQYAFEGCNGLKSITIKNPKCQIYDESSTITNGFDDNFDEYFSGVICGYKDSTAQEYAEKYGRKFAVIGSGDINCDGEITISDVVLFQQALANETIDEALAASVLDVNHDGKFDVFDLILIKRMVVNA